MITELETYLAESATPEMADTIAQACRLFEDINLENYSDRYIELLMLDGDQNSANTFDAIVGTTRNYLVDILRNHGIALADEAPIHILVMVGNGVLRLQQYEQPEMLLDLLEADLLENELFANILEYVCPLSSDDILTYLDETDAAFLQKLQHLLVEQASVRDVNEEDDEQQKEYVAHLRKFCDVLGHRRLIVLERLAAGAKMGYPFAVYADPTGRTFESMLPEDAAENLLAMALVSSDGHKNPRGVIAERIDTYVADLNKITRITNRVSDLLIKMG